jgi:hypothetical protein
VTKDGFEEGGAYPCGAEHDSPDFCVTCGAAVGNPLTPEGEEYVREFVEEVENPNRLSCAVYYPYNNANARNNARRLRETYPYLFEGRGVAISTPDNLAPSKEG